MAEARKYYLAVDIGASSGRHILSWRENGALVLKEIYRFQNLPTESNGHLTWDLEGLCREVVNGLKECARQGYAPDSVGIDTWAVDYVLLDQEDKPVLPMYCYRDKRGVAAAQRVHQILSFDTLYAHTGIQFQPFNTIYQLYDDKCTGRLDQVADFLMLPEYLGFYLSGVKQHEYTNASSTGLLNAAGKVWDMELVHALGLPEHFFEKQPKKPPFKLGALKPKLAKEIGFCCDVLLPATHDTASAIAALPQKGAYISSGTWSLLGAELAAPITGKAAQEANFTNEGGVGTIRFLKNIMGLWLVQCLKRELQDTYSFAELAELARESSGFDYALDVNAQRYLAPKSVMAEICAECREKGWPVPETAGEYAHAIYQSLAHAYAAAIRELEEITGQSYDTLCIVGGGANNQYLNELTQEAIKRPVVTGASEATALGNIMLQEAYYV